MAKFIELTSRDIGESVLINIEDIICIYPNGCMLILSGTYSGTLNISRESMTKLLSVITVVDNAPTVDAQPIIHAEWKQINKNEVNVIPQWKCSECGAEFKCFDMDFEFCPNCGAKMDEEG